MVLVSVRGEGFEVPEALRDDLSESARLIDWLLKEYVQAYSCHAVEWDQSVYDEACALRERLEVVVGGRTDEPTADESRGGTAVPTAHQSAERRVLDAYLRRCIDQKAWPTTDEILHIVGQS